MEYKKAVMGVLILSMLLLAGCSEAMQKEELVERAVFFKEASGFVCCLQGEESEIRAEGDTIYACWDQAVQQVHHRAALGMMSDVYVGEELAYEEVVQIAQALQQAEIPLPAMRLYAGDAEEEANSEVKGFPITAVLNGQRKLFLPTPDGESGRLYAPGGSASLSGAQAQAAMLLAGERNRISVALLCEGQPWRLRSEYALYTVEKQPGQTPTLTVQLLFAHGECLQDGRIMQNEQKQALSRQLQAQIEALLQTTGTEPYGIAQKLRLQKPDAAAELLCVQVRISETL